MGSPRQFDYGRGMAAIGASLPLDAAATNDEACPNAAIQRFAGLGAGLAEHRRPRSGLASCSVPRGRLPAADAAYIRYAKNLKLRGS